MTEQDEYKHEPEGKFTDCNFVVDPAAFVIRGRTPDQLARLMQYGERIDANIRHGYCCWGEANVPFLTTPVSWSARECGEF